MNYNLGNEKNSSFYVDDVLDSQHAGWLEGKTSDEIIIPLCYGTAVTLLDEGKKSQTIRVDEGDHEGAILTIPYKYQGSNAIVSFLSKNLIKHKTSLILDTKRKLLNIKNVGSFSTQISPKIKHGDYFLQIPARPIRKTFNKDYFDEKIGGSRFVETWFRLVPKSGILEDVFLHYGSYSDGCITVLNNKKFSVWNKIYLELLKSRFNNLYVASISIQ